MKGDDILDRLLDLAARIGTIVDALPETRLGRHVAGQLIRCGTSGPANYNEGRAGESRNDFIHKLFDRSQRTPRDGCVVADDRQGTVVARSALAGSGQ